jgi:hypothetical protein
MSIFTENHVDYLRDLNCYCEPDQVCRSWCPCGAYIPGRFIPLQAHVRGYLARRDPAEVARKKRLWHEFLRAKFGTCRYTVSRQYYDDDSEDENMLAAYARDVAADTDGQ